MENLKFFENERIIKILIDFQLVVKGFTALSMNFLSDF